jgi:hypothetical protein
MRHPDISDPTMKRIFIALALALALSGAMLVTTILGYFG